MRGRCALERRPRSGDRLAQISRVHFDSEKPSLTWENLVGDTGFEPVTSSVSGKRATAAPIAHVELFEVGTGFEPVYTDLQSVASPLGQPTAGWVRDPLRADDEARTRDLNLGKVALYQLSYVRLSARELPPDCV